MLNKTKEININLNKNLCEFYGALMGDGCLCKFKRKNRKNYGTRIIFTGHKILDKEYHERYLNELIKEEFNIKPYIYVSKIKNIRNLIISNNLLFKELKKLGFPIGEKGQKLKIPNKLMKLPWNIKKYIIRGFFDTDGCIYARKDENYRYPHISLSTNSKILIKQLYKILKERNYHVWISKGSKLDVRLKGIKNTIKWMDDIGSSNLRHTFKYEYFQKNGILPANLGPVVKPGITRPWHGCVSSSNLDWSIKRGNNDKSNNI